MNCAGWKSSITLEELGVQYNLKPIDLYKGVQKESWFLAINPNGRIPALVDHSAGDLPVFETGAIMWYIAQKEDKSGLLWPKDFTKQADVMSWLMFQMGGVGPMQGQANHFVLYAPEKIFYAMTRYVNETKRLYQVLDNHLAEHQWLAADQYTIADIANFAWVFMAPWAGIDLRDFCHLKRWHDAIVKRPAVQKGLCTPDKGELYKLMTDEPDKAMRDARKAIDKAKDNAA